MPNLSAEEVAAALIRTTEAWIDIRRKPDGSIDPGVLGTGVAVTKILRTTFPLTEENIATASQIKGQTGPGVSQVLASFGETRRFLSEGGRTSRGSRDNGIQLALQLTEAGVAAGYANLDDQGRARAVDQLQQRLVQHIVTEYFERQRLVADSINPAHPAKSAVAAIMQAAIERGGTAAGAVAQHLVGAKLSLRFPSEQIGRDSYTTADQQTARAGDFQVGDTAFHVTMSPSEQLFRARCAQNVRDGFRPVVVVPESKIDAARQLAELAGIMDRVDVIGLEAFVGLNVEEMASFRAAEVRSGLRRLLHTFNDRIREIESNVSLQVEIPANL